METEEMVEMPDFSEEEVEMVGTEEMVEMQGSSEEEVEMVVTVEMEAVEAFSVETVEMVVTEEMEATEDFSKWRERCDKIKNLSSSKKNRQNNACVLKLIGNLSIFM